MKVGEKIAWIWVWSAMAAVSTTVGYGVGNYWALPYIYLETHICEKSNGERAARACNYVLSQDQTPYGPRLTALRRAIVIANGRKDWFTVIKRTTSLIEMKEANAEDINLRGVAHFTLRNYENAAKDFAAAAGMNQVVGMYWSNLADAQIEMKKYHEAFDNYTIAIKNGEDTAEVLGNRGWASYQLGSYETALVDYSQAVSQDGLHADNLNERGLVRHAMGDYENALSDYDRSLAMKPDEPVILTNRAVTFARMGNAANARRDLDRALARKPDYEPARVEKVWLLIDDDQPESALAELQVLERDDPLSVSALEASSRAHLDLGNWQDTIADADRALALGSTSDWPYDYRAKAKRGLGDYEGSIADITFLITRKPNDIDLLATRAILLQLAGKPQAALDEMNRAIADKNDPSYAYEIRSAIHLNSGNIRDAISDARQSVSLAPQSAFPATALGWALIEDQKPADAIKECSRSLTLKPTASAYACRAIAELALQRIAAAAEDANLALDYNRRLGLVYLALGRVDLAQGRPARAAERFSAALKFDIYKRAELFMYRGDAETALGRLQNARADYEMARKLDSGLHRPALDERVAKVASQ